MRRLVLFDIDGTLLTSASAGRRAILRAFGEEFSDLTFFDRVRFDGKTDPQIVRELYVEAGRPHDATPERIEQLLIRYSGHLHGALAERAAEVRPLPGIVALLEALRDEPDVVVGLLTGNIVHGARLKLAAAGLAFDDFRIGAFGSDHADRPELPAIATARAESLFGYRPAGRDVIIVGDTPADVTCGAGIGARAIAVATGSYRIDALAAAGAAAVFETLADTRAVLEAMQ